MWGVLRMMPRRRQAALAFEIAQRKGALEAELLQAKQQQVSDIAAT